MLKNDGLTHYWLWYSKMLKFHKWNESKWVERLNTLHMTNYIFRLHDLSLNYYIALRRIHCKTNITTIITWFIKWMAKWIYVASHHITTQHIISSVLLVSTYNFGFVLFHIGKKKFFTFSIWKKYLQIKASYAFFELKRSNSGKHSKANSDRV